MTDALWEWICDHVMFEPNSGCWLWAGGVSSNGYTNVNLRRLGYPKRQAKGHRALYEMLVGPIPDGLVIDHKCRVHSCVNPQHLEPVTPKENLLRGIGFNAINAAKTHCLRGHPLSHPNVWVINGSRFCKLCGRARGRESRVRDKQRINGR